MAMKTSSMKCFLTLCLTLLAFSLPVIVTAATEQRVALVIGNSAYSSGPLKNPVNDAADMAVILKKLGFTVTLKQNTKQQEMDESIREFGRQLKRTRGVGLFFYAGHGIQIGGVNYLLPVNARIEKESDVRFHSVNADMVLAEMENAENGINIVILDACRDNPYSRSFRSASRGLAIVSNAPAGTFISYSTGANQVARDGEGKNSPYTKALLENIAKPGLTINDVFMNVRTKVKKETGQVPWELSSLEGRFYFNDRAGGDEESKRRVDAERQRIAQERELLEKQRTLEAETEKLEALKREQPKPSRPAVSKTKEVAGPKPSVSSAKEIKRDGRFIAYNNGTVSDMKTGLMWAAKDNGSNINWANAKSYCENYRGGGYTDWRMPTADELVGLYDAGKSQKVKCGSSLNHAATDLINLTCWWAWASETRGSDAGLFGFDHGFRYLREPDQSGDDDRTRALPVRFGKKEALEPEAREKQELERQNTLDAEREQLAAERQKNEAEKQQLAIAQRPAVSTAGETGRDGRFIAYSNETVLDTQTNLMWAAKDNGSDINWANAKRYSENYRGGGYTDWRMPTQDELAGLYDTNKKNRHGYKVTYLIDLSGCCPWASETRGSDAAAIIFVLGTHKYYPQSAVLYSRALPVRFGK